jgi:prophage regulatory protein
MKSLRALTITDVMEKIGGGRTFIYRAMQANAFPKPIRVGRRSSWIESEVEQWLTERIAERDAGITATDAVAQRARGLWTSARARNAEVQL